MKTLHDVKNEVAEKYGCMGWDMLMLNVSFSSDFRKDYQITEAMIHDEVAELYASQFKASEPIEKDFEKGTDIQAIEDYIYDSVEYYRSIVNPGIDEMLVEKIRHKYTIKIIKHHP
jgi:hypothetical protein